MNESAIYIWLLMVQHYHIIHNHKHKATVTATLDQSASDAPTSGMHKGGKNRQQRKFEKFINNKKKQ